MTNRIQTETHFRDLIDTKFIIDENERLPGADGAPGKGLKISEAVPLAEHWWDLTGRFSMPDFGKDPHEQIVKSGIMMGLPWFNLDKQERLRVLAQWYAHIGVHRIIGDKSSSGDDSAVKVMDAVREAAAEILPVLDTKSTHDPTAKGDNDAKEREAWGLDYEKIEKEDKVLIDAGLMEAPENQKRENYGKSKETSKGKS